MPKLYYAPGACSLAPHIIAREIGITFDLIRVDLRAKTYAGGDFKKVNPKGGVPVWELDNGQILTEASVILQYLADQKPGTLIPAAGTWERYKCQEWLNYISTELHKGFSPLFKPGTPEDYKKQVVEQLHEKFAYLSRALEGKEFLLGAFGVADAYLFTVLSWTHFVKVDLSAYPVLLAYMERVSSRPTVAEAVRTEKTTK